MQVIKKRRNKFYQWFVRWVMQESEPSEFPMCDFDRVRYELRPGDVLLIEGRNRIAGTIKFITQSTWTHAALYIGRLHDIDDPQLRQRLLEHYKGNVDEQMLIEGILGKGTIVSPLSNYQKDHVRICRPTGITRADTQRLIAYTINMLGYEYNIRQILDLARLLLPTWVLPHLIMSSLFKPIPYKRRICSSLLAEAFDSIQFPIVPKIIRDKDNNIQLIPRNPNLITPRDFDYSPYFSIIKYPIFGIAENAVYRNLPWNKEGLLYNGEYSGIYNPAEAMHKEKHSIRKIFHAPDKPETD